MSTSVMTLVLLVAALVLLVAGAEGLVKGASKLASTLGISPLVIGLTIVAYGTSSPELAVSVQSSWSGQSDIAVGNVVGSNIFNVLVILGLSALVSPLLVAQQLIRIDVPIMIGVSVLMFLLGLDGQLGRLDGLLLFSGAVAYTAFQILQSRQETDEAVQAEYDQEYASAPIRSWQGWLIQLGYILGGLVLLGLGSRWLVVSATTIARAIGISELVIGLTIVAAGTSLPELATSIVASLRGERDIAVGNIVGSNIFNILAVLGLSSLVAPEGIPVSMSALRFDIPVMLGVAIACLPIFFTGQLISRWEGLALLGYYMAYATYLVLATIQHNSLSTLSWVMILFVSPMILVTLLYLAWRAWRRSPQS
jgi:cation:H+ antiporter